MNTAHQVKVALARQGDVNGRPGIVVRMKEIFYSLKQPHTRFPK
jgi:hypothetical protein